MTKELKIEQVDREAAWHYADFHCLPDIQMSDRWFSGYYDNLDQGHAIRAFARHRLSTRTPPTLDVDEALRIYNGGMIRKPDSVNPRGFTDYYLPKEAMANVLTALSGTGWRGIDSAPKDGRYLIVARFRNGDELCWVKHSRFITAEEIASFEGGTADDYAAGWTDGNDDEEPCYPTHWMPLPLPPQAEEPQHGE
jgi:hypothetical protein